MTDSSIIQRARDVLAKWREASPTGPWKITPQGFADQDGYEHIQAPYDALEIEPMVALLIAGTAGNPDLLDAIDALLAEEGVWRSLMGTHAYVFANRFAAAIIAADERMSA